MTFEELKKGELDDMVNKYIEIRPLLYKLVSFEEFLQIVRRCEVCGELCVMDEFDEELPIVDGKHMCSVCEKDSEFHYMHPEEDMMTRWDECE